jgi:hypothetical protein
MRANHEYFLGFSSAEQRRLQHQAGELADESAWHPFFLLQAMGQLGVECSTSSASKKGER